MLEIDNHHLTATYKIKRQQQTSKPNRINKKFPKPDPLIEPIFPKFTKETSKLETKKKLKDRKAGFYIDTRNIYPPFKRDKDNFFMCDYPNPKTKKPCNLFFAEEKSINAHYSRVHNKDQNPNRIRKQKYTS